MNSANAIDLNNVDLGAELAAIKKDLDQGFLHFHNINSEQNNRYIGYFVLILATNIEGFTTSCLHEITKIKNISQEKLEARHLNAFSVLHFFGSFNTKDIPYEQRGFERADIKLAHELITNFIGKSIVNEKSLKLKHFNFRMNQWTKLLSVYSIDNNLEKDLEETIKEILNERNALAHGGRRSVNINQSLLKKYHEATLEYLELIKTNTEDLLYRCSG
ncbi:MAG: HEPN domain-containing protein [bacterium]